MAAVYASVVPLFEVPSGVLADRWSRRGVLILACVAAAVSVTIGGLSQNVATYMVAALFLALFFAMQSGTVESIVYDAVPVVMEHPFCRCDGHGLNSPFDDHDPAIDLGVL
jgi:MFS family permease